MMDIMCKVILSLGPMDGHEDEVPLDSFNEHLFVSREDRFKEVGLHRTEYPAREMDNEDPSGGVWKYRQEHYETTPDGEVIGFYEWVNPGVEEYD